MPVCVCTRTHTHTRPCIRYVVMFDLRHYPETVVIGIGQQDPSYIPAKKHAAISKLPARKRAPVSVAATHAPPGYKMPYARDRLPITNQEMTQYFVNVTVGAPKQTFTVIFDTGSAVFGIFTRCGSVHRSINRWGGGRQPWVDLW